MKQMMRVAAMAIAGMMVLSAAGADAYIESSGAQAIDTGYYPNPNTKIEVDFQYTKLVHQSRVISTETTDTNYLTVSLYNSGQVDDAGNLSWAFKDGTGNWTGTGSFAQKTRTVFVIDSPNNYYTVVTNNWTGEKFWTRDFANINQTRTKTARFSLVLFAGKNSASGFVSSYYAHMRLYSLKIWESGRLIHYFLPWKSGDDIGLKDVMTGETFTSATATPFTCGGDITDDPQGDPFVLGEDKVIGQAADASLREGARSFTPGDGVALSVPAFGGAGDVFVNDGSGGIVTFSPANSYLGDTYLMRGTLEGSRFVADGAFGSLGGAGTFLIGPGTFRYAGPDGGVFSRDIACFDGWKEATTFDIQNDLTLTGEFFWEQGGFVLAGGRTRRLRAERERRRPDEGRDGLHAPRRQDGGEVRHLALQRRPPHRHADRRHDGRPREPERRAGEGRRLPSGRRLGAFPQLGGDRQRQRLRDDDAERGAVLGHHRERRHPAPAQGRLRGTQHPSSEGFRRQSHPAAHVSVRGGPRRRAADIQL